MFSRLLGRKKEQGDASSPVPDAAAGQQYNPHQSNSVGSWMSGNADHSLRQQQQQQYQQSQYQPEQPQFDPNNLYSNSASSPLSSSDSLESPLPQSSSSSQQQNQSSIYGPNPAPSDSSSISSPAPSSGKFSSRVRQVMDTQKAASSPVKSAQTLASSSASSDVIAWWRAKAQQKVAAKMDERKGYLDKLRRGLVNTWSRRFVRIIDGYLVYANSDADITSEPSAYDVMSPQNNGNAQAAAGSGSESGAPASSTAPKSIKLENATITRVNARTYKPRSFVFAVKPTGGRSAYFSCDSEEQLEKWMQYLSETDQHIKIVVGLSTREDISEEVLSSLQPFNLLTDTSSESLVMDRDALDPSDASDDMDWNEKYQSLVERPDSSYELSIEKGMELAEFVGRFLRISRSVVRHLVDQYARNEAEKSIQPMAAGMSSIFSYQNMVFRLAIANRENFALYGPPSAAEEDSISQEEETSMRLVSHEMKGAQAYAQAAVSGLYIPLACVVDYRGFRVHVTAKLPLEPPGSMVFGVSAMGSARDEQVASLLRQAAASLHLKEHVVFHEPHRPVLIHTSVELQAHRGTDARNYVLHLSRVLPPDAMWLKPSPIQTKLLRSELVSSHWEPLSSDAFRLVGGSAPDSDRNNLEVSRATQRLVDQILPETVSFLDDMRDRVFDSSTLTAVLHSRGVNIRYLGRIAELSHMPHIRQLCVTEMVARTVKHILRRTLRDIYHCRRDLSNGKTPYAYMAGGGGGAPSPPTSFDYLGNPIMGMGMGMGGSSYDPITGLPSDPYSSMMSSSASSFGGGLAGAVAFAADFDQLLRETVCDCFNLVLGTSTESDKFIRGVLKRELQSRFGFALEPTEIHRPSLFVALQYHCGVIFTSGNQYRFSLEDNPLRPEHFVNFCTRSKYVRDTSHFCAALAERAHELRQKRKYHECLEALKLKLQTHNCTHGLNNLEAALLMNDIASICDSLGDGHQAQLYGRAALGILKRNHYSYHAASATVYITLCSIVYHAGDREEALRCHARAEEILSYHLGVGHPLLVDAHLTLGTLLFEDARIEEASASFRRANDIAEKSLGKYHVVTAACCQKMGDIFFAHNQIDRCATLYRRALDIRLQRLGESHPDTAYTQYCMALVQCARGEVRDALTMAKRVLETRTLLLGDANDQTLAAARLCATICEAAGEPKLASDYHDHVLRALLCNKRIAEGHPPPSPASPSSSSSSSSASFPSSPSSSSSLSMSSLSLSSSKSSSASSSSSSSQTAALVSWGSPSVYEYVFDKASDEAELTACVKAILTLEVSVAPVESRVLLQRCKSEAIAAHRRRLSELEADKRRDQAQVTQFIEMGLDVAAYSAADESDPTLSSEQRQVVQLVKRAGAPIEGEGYQGPGQQALGFLALSAESRRMLQTAVYNNGPRKALRDMVKAAAVGSVAAASNGPEFSGSSSYGDAASRASQPEVYLGCLLCMYEISIP